MSLNAVRGALGSLWLAAALGLSLALAPDTAMANLVFGRVSGGGFAPRYSFHANGRSVSTDDHAQYRIVLDPGRYVVTFVDKQSASWVATIVSDSGPIKQDIVFRKK